MYIALLYVQDLLNFFWNTDATKFLHKEHGEISVRFVFSSLVTFVVHPCPINFRILIAIATVSDPTDDDREIW